MTTAALLTSPSGRAFLRKKAVEWIRAQFCPEPAVHCLIFGWGVVGGSDGLDFVIDVLSEVGPVALRVAREFFAGGDPDGWTMTEGDDARYVLLRAVCRSDVRTEDKTPLVLIASAWGTPSVREAVTHAVSDMAEVDPGSASFARSLLARLARDPSPMVRSSASEAMTDIGWYE